MAYGAGFENRLGASPRGFESHSLRQTNNGHRKVAVFRLNSSSVGFERVRVSEYPGDFHPLSPPAHQPSTRF